MLFLKNAENNQRADRGGFTLMEVMIAITVLMVGVVGAYSAVQKIVSFASTSSFQLPAIYLSQEGLEIVRNIRDTNWLDPAGPSWDQGIVCCAAPLPSCECEADYRSTALELYQDPGRFLKIYDSGNGDFYCYSTSADAVQTAFKRKILITPVDEDLDGDNDVLGVRATVSWTERGRDHEVVLEEKLYKYQQP